MSRTEEDNTHFSIFSKLTVMNVNLVEAVPEFLWTVFHK